MANPLDAVTTDYQSVPLDEDGRRRVVIKTPGSVAPDGDPDGGSNMLTRALAPEQPAQQPWTIDDLFKGLSALKEYVANGEFSPGTKMGNRLFGTGGEERYQTWPEKLVRSGVGAAGNALSSLEPITSEQLIAPAMDMAGLAGGSALIERPGAATLGSGPVRPGPKAMPKFVEDIRPNRDIKEWWPEAEILGDTTVPIEQLNGRDPNRHASGIRRVNKIKEKMQSDKGYLERLLVDQQGNVHEGAHRLEALGQMGVKDVPVTVMQYGRAPAKILLSDTSQPGMAVSAAASAAKGPAPVFYSALEHAATNAAQDVMTPQQWLGYLKNQPGVKAEELQWTGIGDWLGTQKGKVRKEDVQRYLDEHKVEIKDVTKESGAPPPERSMEDVRRQAEQELKDAYGDEWRRFSARERRDLIDEHAEGLQGEFAPEDATKYSDYQLPGGENYREHLLTIPQKDSPGAQAATIAKDLKSQYGQNWINDAPANEVMKYDILRNRAEKGGPADNYQSSHWDEPNVLAHVRTNDRMMERPLTPEQIAAKEARQAAQAQLDDLVEQQRTVMGEIQTIVRPLETARRDKIRADIKARKISGPDGIKALEEYYAHPEIKPLQDKLQQLRAKEDAVRDALPPEPKVDPIKSLHIEEIQSDWHQQGRKQGYKDPNARLYKEIRKEVEDKAAEVAEAWKVVENTSPNLPDKLAARKEAHAKLLEEEKILRQEAERARLAHPVPDAPFKTTWPELALKRMIRKAAEEGYDRISWTPGEAQAARYDLSKHLNKVQYHADKQRLVGIGKDGGVVMDKEGVTPQQVADYIGKDAAQKLLDSEPAHIGKIHELRDADLKVGGEGMREFYDKMLPKMVEKIGKAHGVKVKQTNLKSLTLHEASEASGGGWHVRDAAGEDVGFYQSKAAAEAAAKSNSQPVHYFDLPPSLRDHAVGKGFPLYMAGVPFPLVPVDHDPFAKKKERK